MLTRRQLLPPPLLLPQPLVAALAGGAARRVWIFSAARLVRRAVASFWLLEVGPDEGNPRTRAVPLWPVSGFAAVGRALVGELRAAMVWAVFCLTQSSVIFLVRTTEVARAWRFYFVIVLAHNKPHVVKYIQTHGRNPHHSRQGSWQPAVPAS